MDLSFQGLVDRLNRIPNLSADIRDSFMMAATIVEADPGMALTRARNVLEGIIEELHGRVLPKAKSQTLEAMIQNVVKAGAFPPVLAQYANTVKQFGNFGAHQHAKHISRSELQLSLTALMPILEWYANQYPAADAPATSSPISTPSAPPTDTAEFRARRVVRPPSPPPSTAPSRRASAGRPDSSPSLSARPDWLAMYPAVNHLTWWILGAMGGASAGGGLGAVGGSMLYLLGVRGWEGSAEVVGLSAMVGAVVGALLGTFAVVFLDRLRPDWAGRVRGLLAGATLAWLVMEILGRSGLPFDGSIREFSLTWPLAGGILGLTGGLIAVMPWSWKRRAIVAAVVGGLTLRIEGFVLMAESWNPWACVFFGALTSLCVCLMSMGVARGRSELGLGLIGAVFLWAVVEAVVIHFGLLAVMAILCLIGTTLGAAGQAIRGARIPGRGF